MRYFTKQWYEYNIAYTYKICDWAEQYSQAYFEELYQQRWERFLNQQKQFTAVTMKELWRMQNPKEILLSSSEKQQAERKLQKMWKKIQERSMLSEEQMRREFQKAFERRIQILEASMPKELLDGVADIRVMACGVVDAKTYEQIQRWKLQMAEHTQFLRQTYQKHWDGCKNQFSDEIQTLNLRDCEIERVSMEGMDCVLDLDYSFGFEKVKQVRFKHAHILQDGNLSGCYWLAEEFYPINKGFEFHLLAEKSAFAHVEAVEFTVWADGLQLVYDDN